MIRCTTPTHTFKLPFLCGNIKDVIITYSQGGMVVLEKRTRDCNIADDTINIKLTQEETFKFSASEDVYIQVRVLLNDGSALASCAQSVSVHDVLNDEVMV